MIEYKEKVKFLDEEGNVLNPGYSLRMNFIYGKERIKVRESRIKEWDFYQFIKNDWVFQFTIGHASLFGSYSINVFNMKTNEVYGLCELELHNKDKVIYENNTEVDHTLEVIRKKYQISFKLKNGKRILEYTGKHKKFGHVHMKAVIDNNYDNDKLVILTPFFESSKMFYLNYKENYYKADIDCEFGSSFKLSVKDATGLLDCGRGYWPYRQEWYWSNMSTILFNHNFGWNLGWGFGNLKNATENIFFYDNKGYKLKEIKMVKKTDKVLSNVTLDDTDGIFHAELCAFYDNFTHTDMIYIHNQCHQVYYKAKGYIIIDGKKIAFNNVTCFLEHANNQW